MANKTYFVVLIGGPGVVVPCDSHHDQTWTNYIVPIQVATSNREIKLDEGETMQWWVYGPAYRARWADDVKGRTAVQQNEVKRVKGQHAPDYLGRIGTIASSSGASMVVLETPDDVWREMAKLPDNSVSRFWYVGHAYPGGLMLKLFHDSGCVPSADPADILSISSLESQSKLMAAKLAAHGKSSNFYGCYTKSFAEQWSKVYHRTAAGAVSKIDFSVVNQPSNVQSVMERLEKSEATTGWTQFSEAHR